MNLEEIAANLKHLGLEPWLDGRSILDGKRTVAQHVAMVVSSLKAERDTVLLQVDEARRTAEYWKANHLAGNKELEEKNRLYREVTHLLECHGRFSCVKEASALPGCGTCAPCLLNNLRETHKPVGEVKHYKCTRCWADVPGGKVCFTCNPENRICEHEWSGIAETTGLRVCLKCKASDWPHKRINEQCWCAAKAEAKDAVCPLHG